MTSPGPDRIRFVRIAGAVARRAPAWESAAVDRAVAIAEVKLTAAGRADLLAECAGLALGYGERQPEASCYRQMAELCIAAGADQALIQRWTGIGRQRAATATAIPYTGYLPSELTAAYAAAMNATVTAAAIGVGGSVIVALAAFWASVRNTNKTTALTQRALELTNQGLELTEQGVKLTEQGQVTDRYTKAIEQLGSDKLDVRIGGIYALERVTRDSPRDHPTVMEVLAAFVREHSREVWPPATADLASSHRMTRPDVQAAVTVLGRRNSDYDQQPVNLEQAELIRADLADVNLSGANLDYANLSRAGLSRAHFTGANLTYAKLDRADLAGAELAGANLTGAALTGANLTGANLTRANLTRANLLGADLAGAGLTGADLTGANLNRAGLTGAAYGEDRPTPEGWVRDPNSGRLSRASGDTGDAAS